MAQEPQAMIPQEMCDPRLSIEELSRSLSLSAEMDYASGILTVSLAGLKDVSYLLDARMLEAANDCTLRDAEGVSDQDFVRLGLASRSSNNPSRGEEDWLLPRIMPIRKGIGIFVAKPLWEFKPYLWEHLIDIYENIEIEKREAIRFEFDITPKLELYGIKRQAHFLGPRPESLDAGYRLFSGQAVLKLSGRQIKSLIDLKNKNHEADDSRKGASIELRGKGNKDSWRFLSDHEDPNPKPVFRLSTSEEYEELRAKMEAFIAKGKESAK